MLTAVAAGVFLFAGLLRVRPAAVDRERRPLCLALICFGIGAVFDVDSVAESFDRYIGVHNASDLLAHCFGLIGVYYLLRALDGLAHAAPLSNRWLRTCLVAALAVSVVLFAVTPMPVETTAFTAQYGDRPTIAAYWAISIAFPTLCLAQLLRIALSNRRAQVPELRLGLRIVAVGVWIGFGYALLKLAEVVSQVSGGPGLAGRLHSLDAIALGVGLLLIAAGLTVTHPTVAQRAQALWNGAAAEYLDYRLRWLWRTICIDAGGADTLDTRGDRAEFRLLRKVVEIRDGIATLLSRLSADDVARIRSSVVRQEMDDGGDVQAAAITMILRQRGARREDPHQSGASAPATLVPPQFTATGPLSLRDEARELMRLSSRVRKALCPHDH